ncbi:transposable element Tcb2 transposase [Trichonephila clavipes]|nr:transposable element Tcb2 transposase [Trichonephila clavipes]
MSSRHHINDFMRGRIIGKIEEGRKITDVAREFDIAHSVVSRLWKSFKTTGMCSRRHGRGRVRSTTPAEDRYIVLSAKRNRRTTAQQVANQFLAASGKQYPEKLLPDCREHRNWTEQDWACVLFSDESRFSLSSDCRRQLIWRESGTAYRPENIQEKDRYPTCSIMVWAGIMINGRTRPHVVANGTMTGQRYIDEVLLPHVRLFRGAVGDKFVFMDDNATCHRTLAVQDCLDSEGIQRLVWPARSPDLNPIENVWDALGRQVAGRNYPPTNNNTLIRALTEEWDKLPQKLLDNVVQSMVTETIPSHLQPKTDWMSMAPETVGTHYVRSIIYGGELIASLRLKANNREEREIIKAAVSANLQLTGTFDLNANGSFDKLRKDLAGMYNEDIKVMATKSPSSPPQTVEDLMKVVANYPKEISTINNGKGKALKAELYPLSSLKADYPNYLPNSAITSLLNDVETKYDDIRTVMHEIIPWNNKRLESTEEEDELVNFLGTCVFAYYTVD